MARMNVSGWCEVGSHNAKGVPVLKGLNSSQGLDYTTTARIATALDGSDKFVRISVDAASYINLGDVTVTATTTSVLMGAGESIVIENDGFTHVAAVTK